MSFESDSFPIVIICLRDVFSFSDYYNSKDLHIGVTNSHGYVVEFSEEGIRGVDPTTKKWSTFDSSSEWDQCLLLEQFDELWNEIWDSVLLKVCIQNTFKQNELL